MNSGTQLAIVQKLQNTHEARDLLNSEQLVLCVECEEEVYLREEDALVSVLLCLEMVSAEECTAVCV